MTEKDRPDLGTGKADVGAMLTRSTIGLVPFAGPILSEIITHFIPNQRQDRIADYLKLLDERLSELSKSPSHQALSGPTTIDLIEEGGFQSARALSQERRNQIARLVVHGISQDEKSQIEAKRLLLLLREIDEDQIIILCSYLHRYQQDEAFNETHENFLSPPIATLESDQDEIDQETLHDLAMRQLLALGLLQQQFPTLRKGDLPQFDKKTGMMKASYTQVSPLGRLLLRRIGLAEDDDF